MRLKSRMIISQKTQKFCPSQKLQYVPICRNFCFGKSINKSHISMVWYSHSALPFKVGGWKSWSKIASERIGTGLVNKVGVTFAPPISHHGLCHNKAINAVLGKVVKTREAGVRVVKIGGAIRLGQNQGVLLHLKYTQYTEYPQQQKYLHF